MENKLRILVEGSFLLVADLGVVPIAEPLILGRVESSGRTGEGQAWPSRGGARHAADHGSLGLAELE